MTSRFSSTTDVTVIGGGVIGLGIAWQCARAGAKVAVVDPAPGRGASWAAAGLLAPVTEAHYGETDLLRLNLASQRIYPEFVSELEADAGTDVGYRATGTMLVARDADDNAALTELFAFQQRLDLDVRRLRSSEVRALEPALSPRVRGGIEVAGDHQVDNRALVTALLVACRAQGVGFVESQVVRANVGETGTSATTAEGTVLATEKVVLAGGIGSSSIEGIPRLPIRPVKGQLVHLVERDGTPVLQRNVRGLEVYLVPRADGRLVVGATVEERGFDASPTAGGVRALLDAAFELVPGIDELELVEVVVGHRPASPDNAPLLGATNLENLFVATGHFRNGLLLLPATARSIAALVTGGSSDIDISAFSPRRFEDVELVT